MNNIFIGLKDEKVRGFDFQVGKTFMAFHRFDKVDVPIHGRVERSCNGTAVNWFCWRTWVSKNLRFSCPGWRIMPLWISRCHAMHGIVAVWKDDEIKKITDDEIQAMDREIENSLAL